jgi:hypothetical protein
MRQKIRFFGASAGSGAVGGQASEVFGGGEVGWKIPLGVLRPYLIIVATY